MDLPGMTEYDEEVEKVEPFEGPRINFSHIESDDTGLRPYQMELKHDIYTEWDSVDNVMLQMPTGTGKTIVFCSIVNDIFNWCIKHSDRSHILIIAHRKELIEQASNKLSSRNISHGIIQGARTQFLNRTVQVASIQTFMAKRTYDKVRKIPFDFIIIDEAHHSMAPSYQNLWEMYPNSKKLGVTATPWRMNHSGFTALYNKLVLSKPINWFIERGYLANYDYYSVPVNSEIQHKVNSIDKYGADGDFLESELSEMFDVGHIRAELYKSYKEFANGKKGIIYAIDRRHAANIRDLYTSKGVNIGMIDGTTPKEERNQMIDSFRSGSLQVIVNVNIFSEGFDCPDIEFVQLARPTKSLSMFLQQIGRALRPSEKKEKAIILDNVGLYNRFGTPEANRHWKHHFTGSENISEGGYNDGSSFDTGFELVEYEPDYSEGKEEMKLVDRVEHGRQIHSEESETMDSGLKDYNIIRRGGLYGLCDRRKRIIVQPVYEDMHPYYKGLIPFKQNGKWGLLYGDGRIRVKAKYYYIGPFTDGLAKVQNTADSPEYYINNKFEIVR